MRTRHERTLDTHDHRTVRKAGDPRGTVHAGTTTLTLTRTNGQWGGDRRSPTRTGAGDTRIPIECRRLRSLPAGAPMLHQPFCIVRCNPLISLPRSARGILAPPRAPRQRTSSDRGRILTSARPSTWRMDWPPPFFPSTCASATQTLCRTAALVASKQLSPSTRTSYEPASSS